MRTVEIHHPSKQRQDSARRSRGTQGPERGAQRADARPAAALGARRARAPQTLGESLGRRQLRRLTMSKCLEGWRTNFSLHLGTRNISRHRKAPAPGCEEMPSAAQTDSTADAGPELEARAPGERPLVQAPAPGGGGGRRSALRRKLQRATWGNPAGQSKSQRPGHGPAPAGGAQGDRAGRTIPSARGDPRLPWATPRLLGAIQTVLKHSRMNFAWRRAHSLPPSS